MIQDLITKLMEEAAEEADHKAWCDTELAANEQTRKEKTEGVEMLHAEIDELMAEITKLAQDITALAQAIAEIDAAVKEAPALRAEEKAKNTETVGDAKEAQEAVTKAMEILKDFYAKAGEATALVQAPEIFDSPYKGMQAESGGVIGMLEVILSDFERLQAETEAAEEKAQKEYDEFMADAEADKAAKTKDMEDIPSRSRTRSRLCRRQRLTLRAQRRSCRLHWNTTISSSLRASKPELAMRSAWPSGKKRLSHFSRHSRSLRARTSELGCHVMPRLGDQ